MTSTPVFLQGAAGFTGAGLDKPVALDPPMAYVVPDGTRTQALYFRGGNSSDEMVSAVLVRDGVPMRWFPIGARGAVHVALRVVEDLDAGSAVTLEVAAPEGCAGTVVVDLGMVEV